jgi:hypothetical protein
MSMGWSQREQRKGARRNASSARSEARRRAGVNFAKWSSTKRRKNMVDDSMIGPINFSESRLRIRRERRQGRGVYYYYNNSHESIASP